MPLSLSTIVMLHSFKLLCCFSATSQYEFLQINLLISSTQFGQRLLNHHISERPVDVKNCSVSLSYHSKSTNVSLLN